MIETILYIALFALGAFSLILSGRLAKRTSATQKRKMGRENSDAVYRTGYALGGVLLMVLSALLMLSKTVG